MRRIILLLSFCALCRAMSAKAALDEVPIPSALLHRADLRAKSTDEGLHLRRISDFLASNELEIARELAGDFQRKYPKSEFRDAVWGWLGDLAFVQGNWRAALQSYQKIEERQLQLLKLPFGVHSLYAIGAFEDLREIGERPEWSEALNQLPSPQPLQFYLAEALVQSLEVEASPGEQSENLPRAIALYESLRVGPYRLRSLEALAWLFCKAGERERSQACCDELTKLDPHHVETLEFDALVALAECRCHALIERGGVADAEAVEEDRDHFALRWLALNFDLQRFERVAADAEELAKLVSPAARPDCDFLWGRSLFQLQKLAQAADPLERFLQGTSLERRGKAPDAARSQRRKNALLCLFQVGAICERPDLLDRAIATWRQELPPDLEVARALYNRGCLRATTEPKSALGDFRLVAEQFPAAPFRPQALAEAIALSGQLRLWLDCGDLGTEYIARYAGDAQLQQLGPILVEAYAQTLLSAPERRDSAFGSLAALSADLALAAPLRLQWTLDFAERLFELGLERPRWDWLSQRLRLVSGSRPLNSADTKVPFLALVRCALADAAKHPPEVRRDLELVLFNHCVARRGSPEEAGAFKLGAEALCQMLAISSEKLSVDNLIWLGDHFYERLFPQAFALPTCPVANGRVLTPEAYLPSSERGEPQRSSWADRGIAAYSSVVCGGNRTWQLASEQIDHPHFERSALRLGRILGIAARRGDQIALLSALREQYQRDGSTHRPLRRRALLELALAADLEGQFALAASVYEQVLEGVDRPVSLRDWICWRLADSALKATASSPPTSALRALKELVLRRRAEFEPLYLEAGLRGALAAGSPRAELEEYKVLFSQSSDLGARIYLDQLLSTPSRWQLFEQYMIWLDAHLALLDSSSGGEEARAQRAFATALLEYTWGNLKAPHLAGRVRADLGQLAQGGDRP